MPTYYTLKKDVPLKPGQTLGFTEGKGYYAITATATEAKSSQPPAQISDAATGGGYAKSSTQPKSAPTQPAAQPAGGRSTSPGQSSTAGPPVSDAATGGGYVTSARQASPAPISDAASGGGYVTQYYTYKDQVPLKPGQTLGYTPGRGYYARDPKQAASANPTQPKTAPNSPPTTSSTAGSQPTTGTQPVSSNGAASNQGRRRSFSNARLRRPISTKRYPVTGQAGPGHSRTYRLGSVWTLYGRLDISAHAELTVQLNLGGNVTVNFDPRTGAVSVASGVFSFIDPGVLHQMAQVLASDWGEALADSHRSSPTSTSFSPFDLEVSVASKTFETPLHEASFDVSVGTDNGRLALNETLSTEFPLKLPGGGSAEVKYSMVTTVTLNPTPRSQPVDVADPAPAVVADLAYAAAVAVTGTALVTSLAAVPPVLLGVPDPESP